MIENYKKISDWKGIVIKEYWIAVLRKFLEDSKESDVQPQLEFIINNLFSFVEITLMESSLNVLMKKELYEDHRNEEYYFTCDMDDEVIANVIHHKKKGELLPFSPVYNDGYHMYDIRDRESRIKYLEDKIKSYDLEALNKEKELKAEQYKIRNDFNPSYERPTLDDLISGDEQMQDWYNSNENN